MNRLKKIEHYGQSVWLDYIRKHLIDSHELQRLIDEDGLSGVTSNPSIFEKAIAASTDYNETLLELMKNTKLSVKEMYEHLAIHDIQAAADLLFPTYQRTASRDGYVSLEVSPELAFDTEGTLEEAKRLWAAVNRPNLLIKIPGTPEGIPAIKACITEGINVNVTLLFSLDAYKAASNAYIEGLEARVLLGKPIDHIASVASFFLSRIDTHVDSLIADALKKQPDRNHELAHIQGKVAIACAKLAYDDYQHMKKSDRFVALQKKGAHPQRVLWASTSTKNPKYSDVLYVESLIGEETVNTIPPDTMRAFRDHGNASATLATDLDDAFMVMRVLAAHKISIQAVTDQLLAEGAKLFQEAFHQLLQSIEDKQKAFQTKNVKHHAGFEFSASDKEKTILAQTQDDWQKNNKVKRLWNGDATLWSQSDESQWIGWLNMPDIEPHEFKRIAQLQESIVKEGITDVVLLGMGGSSLCPAMISETFKHKAPYPKLHILDSTSPAQIQDMEKSVDLKTTLFVVSSKSGSTLEPNILKLYFYKRLQDVLKRSQVGDRFVAITDAKTSLEAMAHDDDFKAVFHGVSSIGGRYSALSNFGMVPAALMGVDIKAFLHHAAMMEHACSSTSPVQDNPGVMLGLILGVCANQGKDKVTLIPSPGLYALGSWLEQLLGESTGKIGKGVIPVDLEPLGTPDMYSHDRLFAYIRLDSAPDLKQESAIEALEKAGHSVVRLHVPDLMHLGAELYRWEIAVAAAGSVMGLNPFNQPDVEGSKTLTLQLAKQFDETGSIPRPQPIFEDQGIQLFTDTINEQELKKHLQGKPSLVSYIRAHFHRLNAGDYVDLSAFLERNDAHTQSLQLTRTLIRDHKKVATCLGFGPRFLHSTGQVYKGGPNTGLFFQITTDIGADLAIPDHHYTFGFVIGAQAQADFDVLAQRSRRALRIHIGKDVKSGLQQIHDLIEHALMSGDAS